MQIRFALCNEVVRDMSLPDQFHLAAKLGYVGLEIAPFTLNDEPHRLPGNKRKEIRRMAEDAGVEVTGLHWLLLTPPGLSITSPDDSLRQRTIDVMRGLVELCHDLGGKTLVHGSPKQRQVAEDEDAGEAWKRALAAFSAVARDAEAANVVYCIEPLSRHETNFINTVEEAARLVEAVGSPAIRTMIDTRAARLAEVETAASLIDRWVPPGVVAHIHFNDRNSRAPGQGDDEFGSVIRALLRNRYAGLVGIEPFDYHPDGPGAAAYAAGYLKGVLEGVG